MVYYTVYFIKDFYILAFQKGFQFRNIFFSEDKLFTKKVS